MYFESSRPNLSSLSFMALAVFVVFSQQVAAQFANEVVQGETRDLENPFGLSALSQGTIHGTWSGSFYCDSKSHEASGAFALEIFSENNEKFAKFRKSRDGKQYQEGKALIKSITNELFRIGGRSKPVNYVAQVVDTSTLYLVDTKVELDNRSFCGLIILTRSRS
ncbi:hypothetical protein LCL97_11410 [Seohaeicola saemankumensis]|nr:hypothetical protein [Seohaeicola saemankumensis]MCA0871436.1 hypothetical protein [Seohaeicola saemankumensis]